MPPSSHIDKVSGGLFKEWSDADDRAEEASKADSAAAERLRALGLSLLPSLPPPPRPPRPPSYTVRKPSERELSLLYAWLSRDEDSYAPPAPGGANPAPYWSRAGAKGALQSAWSTPCSTLCKRNDRHVCTLFLCAFASDFPVPLSFAVLKPDGFTVDALGTWSQHRGQGAAKSVVAFCMELARRAGRETYTVDSLISSLTYWRSLGFKPVPAREMGREEVKALEFRRPVRILLGKGGKGGKGGEGGGG